MPLTFINLFEVPEGRDEEFLPLWREVHEYFATKPGYSGCRFGRSLSPDAKYRYSNVAVWETEEQFRAAHGEQFRALVGRPEWADFPATPTLYEPVFVDNLGAPTTPLDEVMQAPSR